MYKLERNLKIDLNKYKTITYYIFGVSRTYVVFGNMYILVEIPKA